jgi:DNA-binding CsgD family transcriptional regulator
MWSLASRAYQGLALSSIMADNDVTLSMWYAQQAAGAATKAGDYFDLQTSLLHMLSVETRRGNVDRLQQIDRQLADLRPNDSMRAPYVLASQAHRHAWRGQFDEAARSLSSAQERFAEGPDKILVASTIALCLALGGRSQDSGRAVEAVLAKLPEGTSAPPGHGAALYEVATMFCALAEALSSRNISAQRILRRRALYAHQSMVCLRDAVEQLTRAGRNAAYELDDLEAKLEALREFGFGGYARFLVLAAERIETFKTQEAATRPTPSELRIIRALAEGMTTKDIAAEMGRSVYTVQTHIQNLIEKLGCHGRAEAVAAARRLGYLEDAL